MNVRVPAAIAGLIVLVLGCSGKDGTPSKSAERTAPPPHNTVVLDAGAAAQIGPLIVPAFGPVVGAPDATRLPDAGRYTGAYSYAQHIYHTMERDTYTSIRGSSVLELGDDGSVTACLGFANDRRSSVSKYASDDGKHHTEEYNTHRLWSVSGHWMPTRGAAVVTIERQAFGTCDLADARDVSPREMVCVVLEASATLPVATLACRLDPKAWEAELGLDIDRDVEPGPFEFRDMGTRSAARPWLLLGADRGLEVYADRGRGSEPFDVKLRVRSSAFDEDAYRDPPKR